MPDRRRDFFKTALFAPASALLGADRKPGVGVEVREAEIPSRAIML